MALNPLTPRVAANKLADATIERIEVLLAELEQNVTTLGLCAPHIAGRINGPLLAEQIDRIANFSREIG